MRQHECAVWALLCAFASSSCIIDEECDAHQMKVEGLMAACVCKPGFVIGPEGYGCVACGKNEEVKDDECACKEGFSRSTPDADCKALAAGEQGSPCEDSAECGEESPFCAVSEDPGYCTTEGCERSSDCPDGWRCGGEGDASFCQKAPAGLGMSCATNADCAGSDAAYCEAFMSRTCLINDCVERPNKCLKSTVCCDLSALVGTSLCVPESTLTDGKCVGGTDPVSP